MRGGDDSGSGCPMAPVLKSLATETGGSWSANFQQCRTTSRSKPTAPPGNESEMARRFRLPYSVILSVAVPAAVLVGGWIAIRAMSNTVCSSYNDISNDFCDEWNFESPPRQQFPLPHDWAVVWDQRGCGSAGCLAHAFIVRPPPYAARDPVGSYIDRIRRMGWQSWGHDRQHQSFVAAKGRLLVALQSATESFSYAPKRFERKPFVFVAFMFRDEGGVNYEKPRRILSRSP